MLSLAGTYILLVPPCSRENLQPSLWRQRLSPLPCSRDSAFFGSRNSLPTEILQFLIGSRDSRAAGTVSSAPLQRAAILLQTSGRARADEHLVPQGPANELFRSEAPTRGARHPFPAEVIHPLAAEDPRLLHRLLLTAAEDLGLLTVEILTHSQCESLHSLPRRDQSPVRCRVSS
jgi:hypothetical protein